MKVLVVHNRYRSAMPSGENRVVDDEVDVLRRAGVDVETFFRDSDDIEQLGRLDKLALPVSPTYNAKAVRSFRLRVSAFEPDVVHLHNPFPLISPSVIRVARSARVPVVQTVHNFRHVCVAGTCFRGGRPCEDCVGRSLPWPAVAHGCYRDSRGQSLAMAMASRIHRATWSLVDRFLPVSDVVAHKLVEAGVPKDRISVKPNAVLDPGTPAPAGEGVLFAGRLEVGKGLPLLLDAWARYGSTSERTLTIVGDGPLRGEVESASARTATVRYLGVATREAMSAHYARCGVVVVPSILNEALGMTVIEAFAAGRPVVAVNRGAPAQIVNDSVGWLAEPSGVALASAFAQLTNRDIERKGLAARRHYLERYEPSVVLLALLSAYRSVLSTRARSTA